MIVRSRYRGLLAFATLIQKTWVLVLVAGLMLYGFFWYTRLPVVPPGVTVDARAAPELKRETTVPIAVATPIQVYKPTAKIKLKLPKDVVEDDKQHVVASTKTPNDERQHTVTTLLDTATGTFTSYDRVDPLPWLAVATKTQVGVFYGLRGREKVIRLQAQQELLQIKAVRLGATATLDSDGETFVGVGAWARW